MSTKDAHLCECGHTRGSHDNGGVCLDVVDEFHPWCPCERFRRRMVVRAENAVTTGGHRVRHGAKPIR